MKRDGDPTKEHSNRAEADEARYVADYLLAHPDFFPSHTHVLTKLNIPHPSGKAVSLLERQVEVLRKENHRLERRLVDWMETARENDQLLSWMHNFSASLVRERNATDYPKKLLELLRSEFYTTTVELLAYDNGSFAPQSTFRYVDPNAPPMKEVADILLHGKPICRALTQPLQQYLLPDYPEVTSIALVPLGVKRIWGVLLMGSRDSRHFHANLDMTYLKRLGALVDAALGSA